MVISSKNTARKAKRIAIIGGGAAGTSAAWSLARSLITKKSLRGDGAVTSTSNDVHITLIEPCDALGGVACTKYLNDEQGQQSHFINYGVQGGAPASHRNIIAFLKAFDDDVDDAQLSVSFGRGDHHWTNYEESALQHRLKDDIKRFGTLLKWVSRLEFITLFLSIDTVMKWTNLSQEFRERMVYPLVALFFGTGNQTPNMSAAIVARVFTDPSLRLFEYSEDRLIDSEPTNFAFRNLDFFYNGKVRPYLEERGVRILTGHKVEKIIERDSKNGVSLRISEVSKDHTAYRAGGDQKALSKDQHVEPTGRDGAAGESWIEQFDDIVLACPANISLDILGDHATFWERRVLGRVEYFHDLSVTHCDEAYMKRNFHVDGKAIYFIKTYEEDPKLLEMGFDLSGYQSSISRGIHLPSQQQQQQIDESATPPKTRVYQTIFLDQKRQNDLWSIHELDESKIIDRSWWSAFAHTMVHFRQVVPFVGMLHLQSTISRTHTYFAGSWMLINTHDIAVCSGLAVADRLGAPYPFVDNQGAFRAYKQFCSVGHLMVRRS